MSRTRSSVEQSTLPLSEAAERVIAGDWQLPHFQRPYVWKKDQQVALFRSLIERYPVGAILLWKWRRQKGPPVGFDFSVERPTKRQPSDLVIDGQQRLTTIARQFLLAEMEIGEWRQFDGRSTGVIEIDMRQPNPADHISLVLPVAASQRESYVTKDGKVLLPGLLHKDYRRRVIDRLRGKRERERAEQVRVAIRERLLLVDPLPPAASIEEAIESFERINSEGTSLGIVDVAAAQLFFAAPKLSAAIKRGAEQLSGSTRREGQFPVFSIDLMVRSMLFELYGQANPSVALKGGKDRLPSRTKVERAWKRTLRAFGDLKEFLVTELKMIDSGPLQGAKLAVLVASQAFASRTLTDEDRNRLKRWLVLACVFKPYSGSSTNPSVDRDMKAMSGRRAIDWEALDETLRENARGGSSLRIAPEHLSPERGLLPRKHVFHHLTWILAHHHGALDWIRATPIPSVHPDLPESQWDRHHIFPLKHMRESGLEQHANRIGNRAWLSKRSNRGHIKDRLPSDYLRRVRLSEFGRAALAAQSVPESPKLYGSAVAFINSRESLLAEDFNRLLDDWKAGKSSRFEVESRAKLGVREILDVGDESHAIEFKSSYALDLATGEPSPRLRHAVQKAIVSLANSGGGTVLVGVSDDGTVLGIEKEVGMLRERASTGRAELGTVINGHLRSETFPKGRGSVALPDFVWFDTERCDGRKVLVIRVCQAPSPIWMRKLPADAVGNRGPWVVFQREGAGTTVALESDKKEPPDDATIS
jgi:hypothetical protein